MGLDMYLSAEKYLSGWEHRPAQDREQFASVLETAGFDPAILPEYSPSATLAVTVMYWRKANAIHQWFVDNFANGVDECQEIGVPRDGLEALRNLCDIILGASEANRKSVAEEHLPPQAGFFFGSTEIDEWYWKDLETTRDELSRILANKSLAECDFTYRASW
jgi:hypothetical protein